MMRRTLLAVQSMALAGALLAAADARGEDVTVTAANEGYVRAISQLPVSQIPAAEGSEGKIAVTRSDGSTGHTKPPDQKEIRKLVGYIRDGMNHADRADKQGETRRVIQNRRIIRTRK